MKFDHLDNVGLMELNRDLQRLHTGASNKKFYVGDGTHRVEPNNVVFLEDQRFSDLLWNLFIESYNEICNRFSKKINLNDLPSDPPAN